MVGCPTRLYVGVWIGAVEVYGKFMYQFHLAQWFGKLHLEKNSTTFISFHSSQMFSKTNNAKASSEIVAT